MISEIFEFVKVTNVQINYKFYKLLKIIQETFVVLVSNLYISILKFAYASRSPAEAGRRLVKEKIPGMNLGLFPFVIRCYPYIMTL